MDFLPAYPLTISPLLSFGLLLILGASGGYIAHRISWLPSITGFIITGFLFGPHSLDIITEETLAGIRILIDVSLGLILYRLGLSLDINVLLRSPRLLLISITESMATFAAVFFILPFLGVSPLIAALIAAIVISSSPAVLLHVAAETGARGPVTDNVKSLVAMNNFIAFLAFTIILPAVHLSVSASWTTIILQPLYRLAGSILIGMAIGFALSYTVDKTQSASQYKLALVIGAIMITLGLSQVLNLSMLFAPLILGITIRSIEKTPVLSDIEFGSTFELFFIALFVYAGANLHLNEVINYAPAIFALVLARILAKLLGISISFAFCKEPARNGLASGLLLIPMAGLAIGLAQTTSQLFPVYAPVVSAIVLGAVAVFETMGPPIAAYAFRLAGETATDRERQDSEKQGNEKQDSDNNREAGEQA